jgi:hypothetical protein
MPEMSHSLGAAVAFLANHLRVIDHRRLDLLLNSGDVDAVFAALVST